MLYQQCVLIKDQTVFGLHILGSKFNIHIVWYQPRSLSYFHPIMIKHDIDYYWANVILKCIQIVNSFPGGLGGFTTFSYQNNLQAQYTSLKIGLFLHKFVLHSSETGHYMHVIYDGFLYHMYWNMRSTTSSFPIHHQLNNCKYTYQMRYL